MEADLVAALMASATVTALVGDRLDWNLRLQGDGLPAIRLAIAGDEPGYTLEGRAPLTIWRVQFDLWAPDYPTCTDLRAAVCAALEALTDSPFEWAKVQPGQASGAEALDGGQTVHRITFDARIAHHVL